MALTLLGKDLHIFFTMMVSHSSALIIADDNLGRTKLTFLTESATNQEPHTAATHEAQ